MQAIGTYDVTAQDTFVYRSPWSSVAGANVNLLIHWMAPVLPSDLEDVAVPIVFAVSPGGYALVNPSQTIDQVEDLCSSGAVIVSPEYRVSGMHDVGTSDDAAGASSLTKALRAGISDVLFAFDYIVKRANQDFGGVNVDLRRMIGFGDSAGGQIVQYVASVRPSMFRAVLGTRCGFGLNTSSAEVRAFYTESNVTPGSPSEMLFLEDSDPVIGTPYNTSLANRVDDDANSAVFLKVGGSHSDLATFGNVTYLGNSITPIEACRRFCNDRMSGLSENPPSKYDFN